MLKWTALPRESKATDCIEMQGAAQSKRHKSSIGHKRFPTDCYSTEKVIFNSNNYSVSEQLNEFFMLFSFKAQEHWFITTSQHSPAPVWPHDRRLPHHWQPDSNDMESDQLPTSRPFSSRPVRGNRQTATHTWHRPLVYVKEEGLAPKHRKTPFRASGKRRGRAEAGWARCR